MPPRKILGIILKEDERRIKKMEQRTRKIMTVHKALLPRDDVDRLCLSRKERERGLASIEGSIDESLQRIENYIKKRKGRLITVTRNNTKSTSINGTKITRKKKKREEKQLYGYFKRQTNEISHEKTSTWLRKKKP